MIKQHSISVLVQDQPGVLLRVCGLFSRRGFNIDSITVGSSEENGLSRMIIRTTGDLRTMEQVEKQLNKLIDVIRVVHLSASPMVARELALIQVKAEPDIRPEIMGIVSTFRASVVDIGHNIMMIQADGSTEKMNAIVQILEPYGILQVSRTGTIAMTRG
ncbi:acetolactate synthase small subunit [Paenibacillus nasutitermitis]|uniref:Acetolactate synthase small subunit n=1 Tax=Paenibacillus nasutitermitis TaxID=1652958 RepID=A0A916YSQ3_9BACL|nr:acetolactate synthase small subunit [Paenibacillus nasutitermitis]GGD58142.1 acetolactate synthase small subunit [Paenibacillus nasutitermitis]